MSSRWKKLSELFAGIAVLIGLTYPAGAASAGGSSIPFRDENQAGTLTLCNPQGQEMTSGSIQAQPFAWKVVSSTPAPSGYKKSILYIYQPLPYVDPGHWTGDQMTDTSLFSNPAHPVVQATYIDESLYPEVHRLPPRWEGLYELRMYFSSPDLQGYTSPYPAAVIQVSGNGWKLLTPTSVACNAGTGTSEEVTFEPQSVLDTPHPLIVDPKPADVGPGGRINLGSNGRPAIVPPEIPVDRGGLAKGSPTTTTGRGPLTRSALAGTGSGSSGHGGDGWTIGLAVAGASVLLGGAGALVVRRRLRTA